MLGTVALGAFALGFVGSMAPLPTPSGAGAAGDAVISVRGHGYGHGRGLGQWGAYGYAKQGWTAEQIVAHYYTGVALESRPNDTIRVRLDTEDNVDTVVSADAGGAGFVVSAQGQQLAANGLGCVNARAVTLGAGDYRVDCQALFSSWATVRDRVTGPVVFHANAGASDSYADNLQVVLPDGTYWVRGDVAAVFNGVRHTTVNSLPLEQYLRSTVALEMSPSWASSGGTEALKAQAIAARSYTLASKAAHAGDTYDVCTSTCESYGGRKVDGKQIEYASTDAAVAATAGRTLTYRGAPILAEYSASSGGYTAAGTASQPYLASVVDDGDAVAGNPDHTWTASIPAATIEHAYPSIGTLGSIEITGRNGLGDLGGRVTSLVLHGSAGSKSVGGKTFREAFGLKSDWFAIGGASERPTAPFGGYFALGPDGGVFAVGSAQFAGSTGGMRLNQPIVGMATLPATTGYWLVARDGGVFSFGSARFRGSTGAVRLNQPVVGMASTPSGAGYWLVAADGGIFAFGDAHFSGSTGAMRLNQPIVAMAATRTGNGYYLLARDGGIFAFGDAVFAGSTGGMRLNQPVVAMAVAASGHGYWLLAKDGGVFAFGDAVFAGSPQSASVQAIGIVPTVTGGGYVVASSTGSVTSYGDAPMLANVRDVVPTFTGRLIGFAGVS
ncbi:MAG: SpoIID/LytB domain-containing protein [Acidimicrobiia bacterium]